MKEKLQKQEGNTLKKSCMISAFYATESIFTWKNTTSIYLDLKVTYNFHFHQWRIRKYDPILLIVARSFFPDNPCWGYLLIMIKLEIDYKVMTFGCSQVYKFWKKKKIQSFKSAFWGSFSFGGICQMTKCVI